MSPSVAWIVTPLSSPAVLSILGLLGLSRASARQGAVPHGPRCPRTLPTALLHAGAHAILLVVAQLVFRGELLAAVIALVGFVRFPPYFVSAAAPLSSSATSRVTLSTFWSL